MKFKLFYKFLFLILFFTLFPLVWFGVNIIDRTQFAIKTSISELHINKVEGIKKAMLDKINTYRKLSDLIDSFFTGEPEWEKREKLLSSIIQSYSDVLSISLLNKNGSAVISISKNQNHQIYLSTIDEIKYAKKQKIAVIFKSNSMIFLFFKEHYFLQLEIDKNKFINETGIERIGEKSAVAIVNEFLKPVINFQASGIYIEELIKSREISNYLSNKMNATIELNSNNEAYLGAISFIPVFNLSIISLQLKSDAYKYAMSIKTETIKLLVSFSIMVLFLSYILSRKLTTPIIKFIEASKKIASGDFSINVEVSTGDELEELARNFNSMANELDRYSKIQIEKILIERQNTQAVMHSTEEGIIMVDLDRRIQLINRKAKLIIANENPEGKELLTTINNETLRQAIDTIFNSTKKQVEVSMESKNYKKYYRIFLKEIKLENKDKIIGFLITFHDITYDKEMEKIKEDFLHSITHDLRNPVSAIKGFSEFLLKEVAGPLNQNQKNMIVSIDRASFRLLQMVNNILDIAKIESGKMELNITKVNIYELIKKCVELMFPLAQKKNIKFSILGENNIEINVDAALIERLYINLIGNAIKFTPEDGRITIGIEIENDWFKSWVEDTGEGIPPEYIDKIFDKFEQVKGQKAGGTGLGLTISKYIVEEHLGKIWAEYRANMGAKFVFKIPLNLSRNEFGKIVISRNSN